VLGIPEHYKAAPDYIPSSTAQSRPKLVDDLFWCIHSSDHLSPFLLVLFLLTL
jgi:hypothetical protein